MQQQQAIETATWMHNKLGARYQATHALTAYWAATGREAGPGRAGPVLWPLHYALLRQ